MLRKLITTSYISTCNRVGLRSRLGSTFRLSSTSSDSATNSSKDEMSLKLEYGLTGVHLDDIDKIMSTDDLSSVDNYYPNIAVDPTLVKRPYEGESVVVIQPWSLYANFDMLTDPQLQLAECVSLGNTIHNWKVVGKKIIFANKLNCKQIVGEKGFDELKETILGHPGATAVFFGMELLSGIQLLTLEKGLNMSVYDRFTVVLNIFRQHARTREAKLQLALAELPYIRSHLRGIHESSETASSTVSLKKLVGGFGDRHFQRRLAILKLRENKLRSLLNQVQKNRDITKKNSRELPTVSIIGYTNSGKTTLVKYLTDDKRLAPLDQLFATLDVTGHIGQLPSTKNVMYLDTVGFISRVPTLLIDAFSTTLKDICLSDLIVHVLDVTHPDHKNQHATVMKALNQLNVPKELMSSLLTIGNKYDLLERDEDNKPINDIPKCDLYISATSGINMTDFAEMMDAQLKANLNHKELNLRVENGGREYLWIRKNCTITKCIPDEKDGNYLICRVIMSPPAAGRWSKYFGTKSTLPDADVIKT